MPQRERRRLRHRRVRAQHLVHLVRRHLLATTIDDLLHPPRQEQVPLPIQVALVPRAQPRPDPHPRVRPLAPRVALHHARPAHHHLPARPRRQALAFPVHHRHLRPRRHPHRPRLALPRRIRIARDHPRRLRHPVDLHHRHPQRGLRALEQLHRQRRRHRAHELRLPDPAPPHPPARAASPAPAASTSARTPPARVGTQAPRTATRRTPDPPPTAAPPARPRSRRCGTAAAG